MPDHEALLAAIPAMSLMDSRRYLLADGVERWRDRQLEAVAAALGELPPDLTVVLIARAKAPAKLAKAVKAADGRDPRVRGAEGARDAARAWSPTPSGSAFALEPGGGADARRADGRQPGPAAATSSSAWRCGRGRGERSSAADLDGDGRRHLRGRRLVALRRPARTRRRGGLRIGERLIGQGENVTGLIYGLASRCAPAPRPPSWRRACRKQVESSLKMHPYAAKTVAPRRAAPALAPFQPGPAPARRLSGPVRDRPGGAPPQPGRLWPRGGMRQRVMIAMALSCNPKLLIADEPTTALDVTIQAQILDLMRTLQMERDTGVILVTHSMGVVAGMADRIQVMYAGHIVETASTEEIFANPRHPYTVGLLKSIPRLDATRKEKLEPIRDCHLT